jgi:hypothetical protein
VNDDDDARRVAAAKREDEMRPAALDAERSADSEDALSVLPEREEQQPPPPIARRLLSPERIRALAAGRGSEEAPPTPAQTNLARSLRDALELPACTDEEEDEEDDGDGFEVTRRGYLIGGKEVRFLEENDPKARARAMRQFLERAIGGGLLATVMAELRDHAERYDACAPSCESLEFEYFRMAQDLHRLELEE